METTHAFRAVVRGNTKAGNRARRTKVIHAESYERAWELFSTHYRSMSRGLGDPSFSVLPPAGYLVRGGVGAKFMEAA